jgi:methionyl-tRNA synthetase
MAERYVGGQVSPYGEPGPLAAVAAETLATYRTSMDALALHEAAAAVYRLISATNEYIAQTEPWTLAKRPEAATRLRQVLFDVAEAVRVAGVLLLPIVPASAREILRRVGEPADPASLRLDRDAAWRASGERVIQKGDAMWPRLEAGANAPPPAARGSMSDTQNPAPEPSAAPATVTSVPSGGTPAPAGSAAAPAAAPAPAPAAGADAHITFDDLMKVDLRAAKVLAAERVPKSTKLLKLTVDAGEAAPRTILAGLAEAYEPEAMVGRTIVIVANLAPRKMMGMESNGMVLAGGPEGARPELVSFAEPPPPGSRVR